MNEEDPPWMLPERTGRHRCIHCLADIPAQEYFEGDFACRQCAAKLEAYPLASTPAEERESERARERGVKGEER